MQRADDGVQRLFSAQRTDLVNYLASGSAGLSVHQRCRLQAADAEQLRLRVR